MVIWIICAVLAVVIVGELTWLWFDDSDMRSALESEQRRPAGPWVNLDTLATPSYSGLKNMPRASSYAAAVAPEPFTAWAVCPRCELGGYHLMRVPDLIGESQYEVIRICKCGNEWGMT